MWINKKYLWTHKGVISFHFFSDVRKKTTCELTKVQYPFFHMMYVNIKQYLWAHKCVIWFLFFSSVSEKNHLQMWNILFFFRPCELTKSTRGPTKVQYHFFYFLVWVKKKSLASSPMCNIYLGRKVVCLFCLSCWDLWNYGALYKYCITYGVVYWDETYYTFQCKRQQ
jgi:hypothetical protein